MIACASIVLPNSLLTVLLSRSWQVRVVSAVTADEALQVVRQTLDHAKDGHSCSCKHTETSSLNDPFMAVVVDCAMVRIVRFSIFVNVIDLVFNMVVGHEIVRTSVL